MSAALKRVGVLGLSLSLLLWAPAALAGKHTLRWTHPDPASVDGFRVHTSLDGAAFDNGTDLSKPLANGQGIYTAIITVPDGVPVELRMSAYNSLTGASSLSADSNAIFLLGAPGKPMVVLP